MKAEGTAQKQAFKEEQERRRKEFAEWNKRREAQRRIEEKSIIREDDENE